MPLFRKKQKKTRNRRGRSRHIPNPIVPGTHTIDGRYEYNGLKLIYFNGEGTKVFHGIDIATKHKIIVKQISFVEMYPPLDRHGEPLETPTFQKFASMFRHEYDMGRKFNGHQHTVAQLDYIEDEEAEMVYIISEYHHQAITLRKWLSIHRRDYGTLKEYKRKERAAMEITRQIVSAIGYMHVQGIAHCDLKPDNILLCPHDEPPQIRTKMPKRKAGVGILTLSPFKKEWVAPNVRVLDFGLSREAGPGPENYHTRLTGTDFFLSPEVMDSKPRSGKAPDIWTIGVIAQMVATSLQPFTYNGRGGKGSIHTSSVRAGEHLNFRWFSPEFLHFSSRCFNTDWRKRATILEIANHPFLNMYKRKCNDIEHPFYVKNYNEPPRIWKVYDVYSVTDFGVADLRRKASAASEETVETPINIPRKSSWDKGMEKIATLFRRKLSLTFQRQEP